MGDLVRAVSDGFCGAWVSEYDFHLDFVDVVGSEIGFRVSDVGFVSYYRLFVSSRGIVRLHGYVGNRTLCCDFDLADPGVFVAMVGYVVAAGGEFGCS